MGNSPYRSVICCFTEKKTFLVYCFERLQGSMCPVSEVLAGVSVNYNPCGVKVHSSKRINVIWDFRGNYSGVTVGGDVNWSFKPTKCGLACVWKPHADKWPLQVDKLRTQGPCFTRPKLLPLLLAESDYRQALRTGRSLRAERWANNKILSEGIFSFPKENGPSQCHIDDRILNLTLNQLFKKNEHCDPFIHTH